MNISFHWHRTSHLSINQVNQAQFIHDSWCHGCTQPILLKPQFLSKSCSLQQCKALKRSKVTFCWGLLASFRSTPTSNMSYFLKESRAVIFLRRVETQIQLIYRHNVWFYVSPNICRKDYLFKSALRPVSADLDRTLQSMNMFLKLSWTVGVFWVLTICLGGPCGMSTSNYSSALAARCFNVSLLFLTPLWWLLQRSVSALVGEQV